MPARPHPQARWMRGQDGIGHINTHGDVVTIGVPQQPDLEQARASAPVDAYAHFVITPGGHVDARMTGPMRSPEFYRLLRQSHPEIAPRWTQTDVPQWEEHTSSDDEHDLERQWEWQRKPSWEERNQRGDGVDPVDLNAYDIDYGAQLIDKRFFQPCPTCKDTDPEGCPRCQGDGLMTTPVPHPGAGDGIFTQHRVRVDPNWVQPDYGPRHQGSTNDHQSERMSANELDEDRQHAGRHHSSWHEDLQDEHAGWSDHHEARAAPAPERRDQERRELRLPGVRPPLLRRRDRLAHGPAWSDVPGLRAGPRRARVGASFDPVEGLLQQFPHWQPLEYGGSSEHRVWGWTDPNGVAHSAGCGAGHGDEQAAHYDAKHLRQRFRRCEAGACNCAQRAVPGPQAPLQAPQAPAERPLVPGDRVQQGWITEIDSGHAVVVDDRGQEDILPVAELQRASRTAGEVEGYSNWHTFNVGVTMDNDRRLFDASRKLVQRGGTPDHLRDWAIKHIIGPQNRDAMADAQEWNNVPEHDRLDHNYEAFKDKHGDDPKAMDMFHGLAGGPEVSDSEPNLIDPEIVNWQELHDDISGVPSQEELRMPPHWTAATAVPLWEDIHESRFPHAPLAPTSMPGPSLVDSQHPVGTCPTCGWQGRPVYGLCPMCGHEYTAGAPAWGYSAGSLPPAHPENVLPPHAEELLHYLRGVPEVVSPLDTKVPKGAQDEADPSYDDDNPSTPDPSPGALTH